MNHKLLLNQHTWRIIDHSNILLNHLAIHSFAVDDSLCTTVGKKESGSTARFWIHKPTLVLGIQDTKLPFLEERVEQLKTNGYQVIVRNSGGLAVVLDEGILNLSLIFQEGEKSIDIQSGYESMYKLIQEAFSSYSTQIDAYEIKGSYCPGSYDLSIGGKKFAGISQRRIRGGIAVQIYLCVTGSGAERAELVKEFYNSYKGNDSTTFQPLHINPNVMASLSELLQTPLTPFEVMAKILHVLKKHSKNIEASILTPIESELVEYHLKRMIMRNEQASLL